MMSVEDEEAFIEELRESARKRGRVHSVLRTQYGIAGGETRKKADPTWPEKFIKVSSYYDHLALKALDNLHRPKPREWWENLVNEAAKWLVENQKIPPGKVAERLVQDFPLSKRTIYKYLRPEYKSQEMSAIRKQEKEEQQEETSKDLGGRPKVLTEPELEIAKKLRSEGKSLREIAEELGVSKDTVSRMLKEQDEEESVSKLSQNLEVCRSTRGTEEQVQQEQRVPEEGSEQKVEEKDVKVQEKAVKEIVCPHCGRKIFCDGIRHWTEGMEEGR